MAFCAACLMLSGAALVAAQKTDAPTIVPAITVDACFNMGTGAVPGVANVIKKGVFQSNSTTTKEVLFFAEFATWLEEDCPDDTRLFDVTAMSSMPATLTNKWVVIGDGANKISKAAGEKLFLEWICPTTDTPLDFEVFVTIQTQKPSGTVGAFKPVTVQIKKQCLPFVAPPVPSNAWTGAGIFFFLVFILTLLSCVGGCGFNYISRGKTGWEIVPGAVYMSACLGKCVREPRYTPQMDYDTPVGESQDHYGATYQADL